MPWGHPTQAMEISPLPHRHLRAHVRHAGDGLSAADRHREDAGLDHRRAVVGVAGELLGCKRELYAALLAGREAEAAEALKLADWNRHGRLVIGHIELRDLVAGASADVAHERTHGQTVADCGLRRRHLQVTIGKTRVAEAVAKAEGAARRTVIAEERLRGWRYLEAYVLSL